MSVARGHRLHDRDLGSGAGLVRENVLTRGLDLLSLPPGARLQLGATAVVEVTGLRNPCVQLDRFADGLMRAVLRDEADGTTSRLAGVMGAVVTGGVVRTGDRVEVVLPPGPARALRPV